MNSFIVNNKILPMRKTIFLTEIAFKNWSEIEEIKGFGDNICHQTLSA